MAKSDPAKQANAYNFIVASLKRVTGGGPGYLGPSSFAGGKPYYPNLEATQGSIRTLTDLVQRTTPTVLATEMTELGLAPGSSLWQYMVARGKKLLSQNAFTLAVDNAEEDEDVLEDTTSGIVNMGPGAFRRTVFDERTSMQSKVEHLAQSARATSLQVLQGLAYDGHKVVPEGLERQFQQLGFAFRAGKNTARRGRLFARKLLRQEALSYAMESVGNINALEAMMTGGGLGTVMDSMSAFLSPTDLALAKRTFNRAILNSRISSSVLPTIRAFRQSANTQFDQLIAKYGPALQARMGHPEIAPFMESIGGMEGLRNAFVQSAWQRFVEPVTFEMVNKTQSPYSSLTGPRLLNSAAIKDLSDSISANMSRDTGEFIKRQGYRFLQSTLQMQLLPDSHITAHGFSGQNVRATLHMLDSEEAAIAAAMSTGNRIGINNVAGAPVLSNRVASFDRLTFRVKRMLDEVNASIADPERVLKAHYDMQLGDLRTGSAGGYWVTIAPKGVNMIERGSNAGNITQFFVPVSNKEGVFTRLSGAKYMGHATPVTKSVLENAPFAQWDNRYSIVSQGLYPISSLNVANLTEGSVQKHAAMGRRRPIGTNDFVDLFSADEMLAAHLDAAIGRVQSALTDGNFSTATKMISAAMGKVFHKDFGFTTAMSRMPTQQNLLLKSKINWQKLFTHHPLSVSDIDLSDAKFINFDKLKNSIGFLRTYGNSKMQSEAVFMYKSLRDAMLRKYGPVYKAKLEREGKVFEPYKTNSEGTRVFNPEFLTDVTDMFINDIKYGRTAASGINDIVAERTAYALGMKILPTSTGPAKGGMITPQLQYMSIPGGMPTVRPMQLYQNVGDLKAPRAGANPRAGFQYMSFADEYGKEYQPYLSMDAMRYGRVGFILDGMYNGQATDADYIMKRMGAYEQQMIASPSFQAAFGEGANLEDIKLSADTSKGVTHVGDILDEDMDLISGVSYAKLLGKHQGGSLVWRGVLGRILESPQTEAQAHIVARVLEKYLPPGSAGIEVAGKMVSIKFLKPVIYGNVHPADVAAIPDWVGVNLGQLSKAIDKINSTRGSNPIELIRNVRVRAQDGSVITARVLDLMLGVRVLQTPRPGTSIKTRDLLYGTHGKYRIKRAARQVTFDTEQIEHWNMEGLTVFARELMYNQFTSDRHAIAAYKASTYPTALFGTINDNKAAFDLATRTFSLEELAKTGRLESTGNLTPAQYMETHPEFGAFSRVQLPRTVETASGEKISSLFMPIQQMQEENGLVFETPLQSAMNKVIRTGANIPSEQTGGFDVFSATADNMPITQQASAENIAAYESAVQGYVNQLVTDTTQKKGILIEATRRFTSHGEGFAQAVLKQDVYGMHPLAPGESAVSQFYARKVMGLNLDNHPGLYYDEARDMSYFYGMVHRSPEIFPRGSMKIYIDPNLKSRSGIFVNSTDMAQLYGDTDGDRVAIMMANAKRLKYILNKSERDLNAAQFEMAIQRRRREYDLQAELANLGTVTTNQIRGNRDLFAHIANLDNLQSAAEVARQQYDQIFAQGVMGNLVYPMQDVLRGVALSEDMDVQTRLNASILHNALGEAREVVLKIAKGGASAGFGDEMFNSLLLQNLIKNTSSITRESITLHDGSVINLAHPQEIKEGMERVSGGQYMGGYFPGQGLGKLPEGVGSEAERAGPLGLLSAWIGIMDKMNPNWYNEFVTLSGVGNTLKKGLTGETGKATIRELADLTHALKADQGIFGVSAQTAVTRGATGRILEELLNAPAMGTPKQFDVQMFARGSNPISETIGLGLNTLGLVSSLGTLAKDGTLAKIGLPIDKLGRATSEGIRELPNPVTDNKVRVMTERDAQPYSVDYNIRAKTSSRTDPDRQRTGRQLGEAIAPQLSMNITSGDQPGAYSPDQQAFIRNLKNQM